MNAIISTRIKGFELRQATINDADLVFSFIKQLAIYEKMLDELKGSSELIKQQIFENEYAHVLLAYYNNEPVGSCIYFHNFSTFLTKGGIYIEDIFILEEYRNRGFGKEIFYQMAKLADELNLGNIEWVCINWNESAIKFYENSIYAKAHPEWLRFRLDEVDRKKLLNEGVE